MSKSPRIRALRRAEARIRTGAAAHLLGGGLDVLAAISGQLGPITGYLLQRARGRIPHQGSGPAGP